MSESGDHGGGPTPDEVDTIVDAPLGTVNVQVHHDRRLARALLRGER